MVTKWLNPEPKPSDYTTPEEQARLEQLKVIALIRAALLLSDKLSTDELRAILAELKVREDG